MPKKKKKKKSKLFAEHPELKDDWELMRNEKVFGQRIDRLRRTELQAVLAHTLLNVKSINAAFRTLRR